MKIHNGDRKFKCKICDKRFVQKNGMIVHMRSHTNERPYKCDICGKGFHQKGNLDHHVNRHMGNFRFKCDICGLQFVQKTALQRHQARSCVEEIHTMIFKDDTFKNPRLHKNQGKKKAGLNRKTHRSDLILNGENDGTKKKKHLGYRRHGPNQTWRKKPHQREKLEAYFEQIDTKPDSEAIEEISKEIGLTAKVVTHWFMNQRAKGTVTFFNFWIRRK